VKLLLTGAGGQLGHDLVSVLGSHDLTAVGHADLDIGDPAAVEAALEAIRPDVVVNAAGWTEVDACESDQRRAFRDNAFAVRLLAHGCRRNGAHLVTISTDYVFDGTKDDAYHEWDVPNPRSVYGASKLAGEREAGPEATIVRTSWLCGEHGPNMVKTILRLLAEQPTLRFVEDQIGHPTFTSDLALVVADLAVQRRAGVYHVTNQGAVSWYEFARAVAAEVGADPDRIEPVTTAEVPRPATRPANSRLDNLALELVGMDRLRDFREPLSELITKLT
jgi:dTDP-4-dehydrorhamnose reductase